MRPNNKPSYAYRRFSLVIGSLSPAYEKRCVQINDKCVAVTRAFSQVLFLKQSPITSQSRGIV
jgi:hypothetical protein